MKSRIALLLLAVAGAVQAREIVADGQTYQIPAPVGLEDATDTPRAKMSRGFMVPGNTLVGVFLADKGPGFVKVSMIGDARKNPLPAGEFPAMRDMLRGAFFKPEDGAKFEALAKEAKEKGQPLTPALVSDRLLPQGGMIFARVIADKEDRFAAIQFAATTTEVAGKPTTVVVAGVNGVVLVKSRAFVISVTRPFNESADLEVLEKEAVRYLDDLIEANAG